jgi:large subunit ribosomal protein L4
MRVPVKDMNGQQVGEVELNETVFAAPVNQAVMHQALVRQLSNRRLGTHDTKSRSEVAGGGKKPWRQKGTGRARQGSTRAPNWVGGGIAFGPTPRKYVKALPKKMNRLALRSALSVKAAADQIVVVDNVAIDQPKTKAVMKLLANLGVGEQSVLLVMPEKSAAVWLSARNLPQVKTLLSGYVNVRDLLGFDKLVLTKAALEHIEAWLGTEAETEAARGA